MGRKKIDWDIHLKNYNNSGMAVPKFCKVAKINIHTFRSKLYAERNQNSHSTPKFLEFDVKTELSLAIEEDGTISIRGLNPIQIPIILQACSNAVSR